AGARGARGGGRAGVRPGVAPAVAGLLEALLEARSFSRRCARFPPHFGKACPSAAAALVDVAAEGGVAGEPGDRAAGAGEEADQQEASGGAPGRRTKHVGGCGGHGAAGSPRSTTPRRGQVRWGPHPPPRERRPPPPAWRREPAAGAAPTSAATPSCPRPTRRR